MLAYPVGYLFSFLAGTLTQRACAAPETATLGYAIVATIMMALAAVIALLNWENFARMAGQFTLAFIASCVAAVLAEAFPVSDLTLNIVSGLFVLAIIAAAISSRSREPDEPPPP